MFQDLNKTKHRIYIYRLVVYAMTWLSNLYTTIRNYLSPPPTTHHHTINPEWHTFLRELDSHSTIQFSWTPYNPDRSGRRVSSRAIQWDNRVYIPIRQTAYVSMPTSDFKRTFLPYFQRLRSGDGAIVTPQVETFEWLYLRLEQNTSPQSTGLRDAILA